MGKCTDEARLVDECQICCYDNLERPLPNDIKRMATNRSKDHVREVVIEKPLISEVPVLIPISSSLSNVEHMFPLCARMNKLPDPDPDPKPSTQSFGRQSYFDFSNSTPNSCQERRHPRSARSRQHNGHLLVLRQLRTRPHGASVPNTVDAVLDAAVGTTSHALEGQAVVDTLDRTLDGDSDTLRAALNGGDEVVDVSLPVSQRLLALTTSLVSAVC